MKKILLLTFSLLLIPASAQKDSKLSPIEQLFKVMKLEQTVIDGGEAGFVMVEQSLADQELNKEEMAEVKDAFMDYMSKVALDPEFKAKTKAVYQKAFTDDEITELVAFYKTPIGQKTLNVLPGLTSEIMAFSQQLAQKHVGSFQDALTKILERKAERENKEDE